MGSMHRYFKEVVFTDWWCTPLVPAVRRQRQVGSRTAWSTWRQILKCPLLSLCPKSSLIGKNTVTTAEMAPRVLSVRTVPRETAGFCWVRQLHERHSVGGLTEAYWM
ncbi:hypothetical protein LEMLEM_LOCUS10717 [Lemmus lemmus]